MSTNKIYTKITSKVYFNLQNSIQSATIWFIIRGISLFAPKNNQTTEKTFLSSVSKILVAVVGEIAIMKSVVSTFKIT